jgi:hypothetical protein
MPTAKKTSARDKEAVHLPSAQSRRPDEIREAHLINLRDGVLSDSGALKTTPESLTALFEKHLPQALEEAKKAGAPLRILFFAHGGLNNENASVATALSRVSWWLRNGVYPIFFIWETGLMETFGQMLEREMNERWAALTGLFGRRGAMDFIADRATDPAVERVARMIGGVGVWGQMKNSAERSSARDTGGAWLAARHLKAFLKSAKEHPVELHAIGHSAGCIFHAHFLAALKVELGADGPTVKTLHLLAPAIRTDLFKAKMVPLLGKGIDSLAVFTMNDAKERDDTCMKVYRKSLLYLIHQALEPEESCPLLGLQKSVRQDAELRALLEPAKAGLADVVWSPDSSGPRHSSDCVTHGGFDDDTATMNSVCRRMLGKNAIYVYNVNPRALGELDLESGPTDEQITLGILAEHALRMQAVAAVPGPVDERISRPIVAPNVIIHAAGGRRALCIGINDYPNPADRLSGCVSDATNWESFFSSEGFGTELLLNSSATYDGILSSIRELVESTKTGDVIAIQYAGHGTQMEALDGRKTESDGLDEALCCYDFRTGSLVLDNDLGAIFSRVKKGVSLSVFLDSCNSGSATRNSPFGPVAVPLPEDAVRRQILADPALNAANRAFRGTVKEPTKGTRRAARNPYESAIDILFAAALPSQFAHESGGAGVFTRTTLSYLSESNGPLTNGRLIKAVQEAFPDEFRSAQQPEIYCSKAAEYKPFLGGPQ